MPHALAFAKSPAKSPAVARAWQPHRPSAQRPWDLAAAGHLLRRSGFGATWDQLQQSLELGPRRSVDRILTPKADVAKFNRTCDEYAASSSAPAALRAWWLRRMIQTPHPLLEKMTLFWHDHFGISNAKAKNSRLMRVESAGDTHRRAAVVHPVTQAGSSPSSILSLQ